MQKAIKNHTLDSQSKSKRIFLILDTTHGQIGGTEQNTIRFAQAILKRGHEPIIIEVGQPILHRSEDSTGISLLNLSTTLYDTISVSEWRSLFNKKKPSVIVRSKTWFGSVNWRLDVAARLSNALFLGWEHHPALPPSPLTGLKAKLKSALRTNLHIGAVRKTVAVSEAVRQPLIDFYPFKPEKIDVIYPGVDFDYFSHSKNARKELRELWGISESAFVIGSLGRPVAHKGNDFTLRVFAELLKHNFAQDLWCVIAGKGPDLERLQQLAEELSISHKVRFVGWQESAPKTWSAFDLFLMPSADEGLGMTLIEAVACGCLALGTAVGGMKEIFQPPFNKYCLPPADLSAWVTVSTSIITNEDRNQEQASVYASLKNRFNADSQWNAMVDWIEQQ